MELTGTTVLLCAVFFVTRLRSHHPEGYNTFMRLIEKGEALLHLLAASGEYPNPGLNDHCVGTTAWSPGPLQRL